MVTGTHPAPSFAPPRLGIRSQPPEIRRDDPVSETEDTSAERATMLLLAFTITTLVMVAGIVAVAVLGPWWVLIPVVLVHWLCTWVIMARIGALLKDE